MNKLKQSKAKKTYDNNTEQLNKSYHECKYHECTDQQPERIICYNEINKIMGNELMAHSIEQSIYNYSVERAINKGITYNFSNNHFKRIYASKTQSLCENINPSSYVGNTLLYQRIINGEIDLNNIAFMYPWELYPELWIQYDKNIKAFNDYKTSLTLGNKTTAYTCGKCKSNNCVYLSINKRSLDEPAVLLVKCLNCNYSWSM